MDHIMYTNDIKFVILICGQHLSIYLPFCLSVTTCNCKIPSGPSFALSRSTVLGTLVGTEVDTKAKVYILFHGYGREKKIKFVWIWEEIYKVLVLI